MLGYLRGKIISKNLETSQCILLTESLGYEVIVPKQLFDTVKIDDSAAVWIHTHVREDAFLLYGFATETEKQFFRVLLGASGLGPKTAMSLLAEHGAEKLKRLIIEKRTDEISEAPGVGKKLAQKIVLELGTKVEKLAWLQAAPTAQPKETPMRDDLFSALQNLGYQPNQIKQVLDSLLEEEGKKSFEEYLRSALKEMSGRASTVLSNA